MNTRRTYINDLRWAYRALRAPVRDDETGELLGFWEKLVAVMLVVFGFWSIEHR